MPTPPYARLAIRINSGAQQFGGITAAHGDEVRLEAESTAFWSAPAAVWEIYDYPEGWAGPGAPWVSITIPQQGNLPDAVVFQYYGNTFPPPFNLPALPYWGKFQFSLLINGGIGAIRADLYDEDTALQILSPNGLMEPGFRETRQFGSWRGWNGVLKELVRTIDTELSSAITLSNATPQAIGTASAGVGAAASRDDHVHAVGTDLTFPAAATSTLSKASGAGAGAALVIRGANGAVGFGGGDLDYGPGIGGIPDVDAPGALVCQLGSNGSVSGANIWRGGSLGNFLTLTYDNPSTSVILTTSKPTLLVDAVTSVIASIGGVTKTTTTTAAFNLASGVALQMNSVSATSAATADALAIRTSGALLQATGFTNGSGTKASAGTVRASATETIVAFRDAGNSVDIEAVSSQGDDKVHLGATTVGQGMVIHAPSAKAIINRIGATDYATLDDSALTLQTAIVASRTNGARSIMSTDLLSGTKGAAVIDHRSDAAYVPTPDATPLVVCSVTVAERASVSINFTVIAKDATTRDAKYFHRNVTAKCESGTVTIAATSTPFADSDDGGTTAGTTIAVGTTADTITITATGIASAVDWYTGIETKSLTQ